MVLRVLWIFGIGTAKLSQQVLLQRANSLKDLSVEGG